MKSDTKFREESTRLFKIGIRNLTNFDLSNQKSQKNFILMGSFWTKYILFELKNYRGTTSLENEEGYKIWRGIDLFFSKLAFWESLTWVLKSLKDFGFNGLLLSELCINMS